MYRLIISRLGIYLNQSSLFIRWGNGVKEVKNLGRNEIVFYKNYAELILYDKQGNEKARTQVDLEDIEKINMYRWYENCGYAVARIKGKRIKLHRFVLNHKGLLEVDHINNNGLDNRKSNLRIVTHQINMTNQKKRSDNTSGVTGVYWFKTRNRWKAEITVNGKKYQIGYFKTKDQAVEARRIAEALYRKNTVIRYSQRP